ncbi:MAG: hypothetical protein PWQ57_3300 [Desulfovibrionales bacterium]|nr:hypothetical protein [Desulfovibrionales bacterium]
MPREETEKRPLAGRFMFDPQDYELLAIVNDVLDRGGYSSFKRVLGPYLHPRGIKEMAATKGLRIAYSVIHLLGSLESGKARDRLGALRALKNETLTAAESSLLNNTARVLLEIMKSLVRAPRGSLRQLKLAHDFRRAVSGKPRIIRSHLRRFHLLEMPEDWSQLAFDDHVHDANTKGRKSPTHLIMDAWIKGLRKLTVVYYNYVSVEAAEELLEAAEIMGVSVRICIELRVEHRGRYIKLLWTPRDVSNNEDFQAFLARPDTAEFMRQGMEASKQQQSYTWSALEKFNASLREEIGACYGVELPEADPKEFLKFVGVGQPSIHHLGYYLAAMVEQLKEDAAESAEAGGLAEEIIDRWLEPERNPDLPNPFIPGSMEDRPLLRRLKPEEMVERIHQMHPSSWISLDMVDLRVEDMLYLLFVCRGRLTHLEVFNLRAYERGMEVDYASALRLQAIINTGNAVQLKRLVRDACNALQSEDDPGWREVHSGLVRLLEDIPGFLARYRKKPLRTRIGSDSTGQSDRRHGMGLVVTDTLPGKARRQLKGECGRARMALPIAVEVAMRRTYAPYSPGGGLSSGLGSRLRVILDALHQGGESRLSWVKERFYVAPENRRNIRTLGGVSRRSVAFTSSLSPRGLAFYWVYMNSTIKNVLKILLGFAPAAATFQLTKDWWLLAWFGPFIWFGITGARNIIQSVLGCGGLKRSPLTKWSSYVSWERVSDSLLWTGFSVPLLDYLVKTLLLDKGFGINTGNNATCLYTVMAVVNGLYIFGHNTFRGLPRRAAVGNFFRSVFSVPLAILFNAAAAAVLGACGVAAVDAILQKWAAIISKLASDCVAGVIEGLADRGKYIRLRMRDLSCKISQIFDAYTQLEMLYPRRNVMELLESPKKLLAVISGRQSDLEKVVIVNALDMLYFWMHQPRSRIVLKRLLQCMTPDERQVFLLSQYVLRREKEVSLLLIEGLVGRKFNLALSFYLANVETYLDQVQTLAATCDASQCRPEYATGFAPHVQEDRQC